MPTKNLIEIYAYLNNLKRIHWDCVSFYDTIKIFHDSVPSHLYFLPGAEMRQALGWTNLNFTDKVVELDCSNITP